MHFDKGSFLALIDSDKELFQSLLELYSKDWPQVIQNIKQGIQSKDFRAIEYNGHRIKGNLRNFYATELSELAYKVEEAGRNENINHLRETVVILEEGLKKLEVELQEFYKELSLCNQ